MKRRIAYLVIEGKQIGDEKHSLQIQFNITYQGNTQIPLETVFVVDNLRKEDIYYITTNTSYFQDEMSAPKKKIEFWCGYEGNVRKIFDGRIRKAYPTGQPDTSLYIYAMSASEFIPTQVTAQFDNITFYELLKDYERRSLISVIIPESLRYDSRLQTMLPTYSFDGTIDNYYKQLVSDITGNAFVKGQLNFIKDGAIVYVCKQDAKNTELPIIPINSHTGMIGIPEPTAAGVDLRVLLDTSIRAGMTIRLESKMLPKYNGEYNVNNVTYNGSTRGKEFYTDLHCTRVLI